MQLCSSYAFPWWHRVTFGALLRVNMRCVVLSLSDANKVIEVVRNGRSTGRNHQIARPIVFELGARPYHERPQRENVD